MSRRAVFLDRDGTLVHAEHYPSRPEQLVLYAGIGPELAKLRSAGFALVMVTNQSGLAHGHFTPEDLAAMHASLQTELATFGAEMDGVYFCPHHPEGAVAGLAVPCGCRKPEPGMLLQGARDLDLDLPRSWFVGDILDDVEAGNRAGCRTILVDLGTENPPPSPMRTPGHVARDTMHALAIIAFLDAGGPAAALDYAPRSWLRDAGDLDRERPDPTLKRERESHAVR
ncbi:MAG: D-glycero-alpha-D-manno-heptose-1,7-bisphosphate 7-phosphatase [Thermomicrobiales bacterium]